MKEPRSSSDAPVLLFDGVCNLCNGAIQFVIDHERTDELRFAPLQSELARTLLERAFGVELATRIRAGATGSGEPDSIVLVDGTKGFSHSTAALQIARRLRAPWSFGYAFIIVPRFVRDAVYRFIARNRYRWFGRTEMCRVPTPELKGRFLA